MSKSSWAGLGLAPSGIKPSARDNHPPPSGSHTVNPSEVTNTTEAIPDSNSPGPRGHSTRITSGTGNSYGAKQATSSEIYPSLKKPDLMR
jgi:hypothetical protein